MGGLCSCLTNAGQSPEATVPQPLHYKPYGGVAPPPKPSYAAAVTAGRQPAVPPSGGAYPPPASYHPQQQQQAHYAQPGGGSMPVPNPMVPAPITNRLPPQPGDALTGVVVKVSDGDTLEIDTALTSYAPRSAGDEATRVRVRMLYMDAPESSQAWGPQARDALVGLVHKARVIVWVQGIDRYNRVLGAVYRASDSLDVNFWMVAQGQAHFYRYYAKQMPPETAAAYEAAENAARARHTGLWSNPNPELPHDYRLRQRGQKD